MTLQPLPSFRPDPRANCVPIAEPPSVGVEESCKLGLHHEVPVIGVVYVTGPEFMSLDLGTSDAVFSDQAAHEPFVLCQQEVATQEVTLQIAAMGFFMACDIMLHEWRANVEDERPEFTPLQRHFVTRIPCAGQYTVSRDDGGIAWRGNDFNGKRTTLYFPRICSRNRPRIAFHRSLPSWKACSSRLHCMRRWTLTILIRSTSFPIINAPAMSITSRASM